MKRQVAIFAASLALAVQSSATENVHVTPLGIGKARFGMTLAQVNAALGEKFVSPSEPDEKGCFYIEPREFEGVALMIEEGKLVRIDVRTASVTTDAGIRIGDRASALKSRYGAQLKDEPHYYAGPEGRYLTLSLNKGIAIRFETSNENVKNWYIGYKKAVQYVEGCL